MAAVGQIIKGKYRVERVLGEGGMGVVVAAQHLGLDELVAIKFLHPAMLQHPEVVARFAREAKAATKIKSDHIARVLDVDALEDGTPFMVMEHLEGSDLASVRRQQRPLPTHVAVGYLLEACEAIGEAHRLGIVHRDLKPANLFLARRPDGKTRVKVLDFGISKMDGPGGGTGPSVTKTSTVMGSAEYMSPEQMMASRDVDGRTDIWALGVTLYELMTCRVPFPGETITHVCALVMTKTPAAPSTLQSNIPPGLDAIVLRCLARDPAHRFSNVGELSAALTPWAAAASTGPRTSLHDVMPATAASPTPASTPPVLAKSDPQVRISTAGGTSILEIEQASTDRAPQAPGATTGTRVAGAPTTGAVSSDAVALPTHGRGPLWAVVAVAAVGLGVAGTWLAVGGSNAAVPAASADSVIAAISETVPSVTAPAVTASPSNAVAVAPVVEPAPASVSDMSSAKAPTSAAPAVPPKVHAASPTTVKVAPQAHPAPKSDCNPPYTIDVNGVHHAKPQCL